MVAVRKPLPRSVTADLIGQAVVAAARTYGDDPLAAFAAQKGHVRRCLPAAARAVAEVTGAPVDRIAQLLGLSSSARALFHDANEGAIRAREAAILACRAFLPPPAPTAPVETAAPATARMAARLLQRRAAAMTPPPAHAPSLARETGFGQLDRMARDRRPPETQRGLIGSEDRALIDTAIAAGKVTVLDPGHAAGLSQLETHLYAAPPPRPEGGWGSSQKGREGAASRARSRELAK